MFCRDTDFGQGNQYLEKRVMSTTDEVSESDVIELEPASQSEPTGPSPAGSAASPRPAAAIAWWSDAASLCGRHGHAAAERLLAAAVSLAAIFGLLFVWVFASDNPGTLTAEGSRFSLRVGLIGLRCLLAAAVAGLLASEVPLTAQAAPRGRVRAVPGSDAGADGLPVFRRPRPDAAAAPSTRRFSWPSSRTA